MARLVRTPLKTFAERMAQAIEDADRQYPKAPTPGRAALRAAFRAIAIQPVGHWHRKVSHRQDHVATLDEIDELDWLDDSIGTAPLVTPTGHPYASLGPPEGYDGLGDDITGDMPLSTWQRHWRRTEWSTTVWARECTWMTRWALRVPREHLIAIDGDGLYVAGYVVELDPSHAGRVGELRLKHACHWPNGLPAPDPSDRDPLDALRKLAKGTDQ